uniref:FBA_2 domain-containing protein n=1 Tax=Steinernema glaseri TaxID=37863 RepID=A0A1I7ZET8_9BILA
MLNSLRNVVFGEIWLDYNGQTSLTFLEQQIARSPFLELIELFEGSSKWPQFVLPLLEMYCLKGRPGRHISLKVHDSLETAIDLNFVEKFFEHWKDNGTLSFWLEFDREAVDPEDWQTLLKKGQVTEFEPDNFRSVIKHETAKSIAICYAGKYLYPSLGFRTCTCDLSEECFLKEHYPEYHDF